MIKHLLEYQKIDAELYQIEESIKKSDERKKVHSAKKFLSGVNESIAKLEQRAEELASKYNSAIKIYEKLVEETKDYEDMGDMDENQLSYVKKKSQSLSEEINNLSNGIDQISKEIESVLKEFAQLRSDTKKAKAMREEFEPKYEELKKSKQAEMSAIKAKLADIAKNIGSDEMAQYEQKRKEKIFPVLNEARMISKDAYCRCGQQLSLTAQGNLTSGKIVECDSCHRLLYYVK